MQAEELKAIRTATGLSQAEFADRLGMSRVFVGMMERGDRPIEQSTALAIRYLDPLRPGFAVGGKARGYAFWVGSTIDQIGLPNPRLLAPLVAPNAPGKVSPQLSYRYSGVTLPETGERIFVPADEDDWDEARAHREGVAAVRAWQEAANTPAAG